MNESTTPTGPRVPAIRVVMMPKDTNALGTIFGGVILSYIDQAGAVEAHRHCPGRIVTVAMREVVFHAPVFVGDLVSFWTHTVKVGNTSVTVHVPTSGFAAGSVARVLTRRSGYSLPSMPATSPSFSNRYSSLRE